MKIVAIRAEMLDMNHQFGMSIALEDGFRHAVRMYLIDLDTEELPERLLAMGKELRKWAREHEQGK